MGILQFHATPQTMAMWNPKPGEDYDVLHRNCCHFSDALCRQGLEQVQDLEV